jgi:hypothetical protein
MWQHHDSFAQQNAMNHHLAASMSMPRIVVPTHSMVPMFPSPDSASKLQFLRENVEISSAIEKF